MSNKKAGAPLTQFILKQIATLWFIGYLPAAPGTWGSLAAAIFIFFLKPSIAVQFWLIAGAIIAGVIASDSAEKTIGESDSGHIIIDEVAGLFISVFFLPQTYGYLLAGFLLFRIFDILKPFPIRNLEKSLKGGAGIMADDILAGFFVNVILHIWTRVF